MAGKRGGRRNTRGAARAAVTVAECLLVGSGIADAAEALARAENIEAEWRIIKRGHLVKVLHEHPDKGGDPAEFLLTRDAFEHLRDLFNARLLDTFVPELGKPSIRVDSHASFKATAENAPPASYYEAAAETEMPGYCAEAAKSNRSSCTARKNCVRGSAQIDKDELRVGSLDASSGAYGRWRHLPCWRVPSRIWLGLPDPDTEPSAAVFEAALLAQDAVNVSGLRQLPATMLRELALHVMNKANWAKLTKARQVPAVKAQAVAVPYSEADRRPESTSPDTRMLSIEPKGEPQSEPQGKSHVESQAGLKDGLKDEPSLAPEKMHALVPSSTSMIQTTRGDQPNSLGRYEIPVPGQGDVVVPPEYMAGETVVLTGIFPELGGGAGLSLGKDRAKKMLSAFGAKVTSSISGKTTILLLGNEPGMSKVSQARSHGLTLMSAQQFKDEVEGRASRQDTLAHPPRISSFSSGYMGRTGLALGASAEELEWAATGDGNAPTGALKAATGVKRKASGDSAVARGKGRGRPRNAR
ncbi:DNA ligase [Porphyridium purpureum]|uniref:DNA ligase n=1 Tax=Porphyridium purpureum TaxID=35688 RepID=A0A5J4YP88_PORPP|nr:DNA ligase [Porphyridium purpureum]|eukprot:POR2047..scf296_7